MKFKHIAAYGATSAIAQQTLRHLCKQHQPLVTLIGRNQSKLEVVSKDLQSYGASEVEIVIRDLSDYQSVEADIATIEQQGPGVDLILLAHGVLGNPSTLHRSITEQMTLFNINTLSPIAIAHAWGQRLRQKKSGTIAVISSVAGDRGRKSNFVYGASKAALSTYLQGLRGELFASQVKVIDLKPGMIDTPMTADLPRSGLMVSSALAGRLCANSITKGKDVAYIPGFWRWIMLVIKVIPESLFKRLSI